MNIEQDPITDLEHAIGRRIGAAACICMLAVVVGAMVAPIFGWWIKGLLYRYYAIEDDCEQRVKHTMKFVWFGLWTIAVIAWVFAIMCNS